VVAIVLVGALQGCGPRELSDNRRIVQSGTSRPQRVGTSDAALEEAVYDQVNAHRQSHGLAPLAPDARISREARRHSRAMAERKTLGHDGFDDRVQALRRVMPCRRTAENVAMNQGHRDPASEAVRGWLGSQAHRQNIEGPYELTGVGIARNAKGEVYFTQIFVGR
jgi:uncharacterized protein YkwD